MPILTVEGTRESVVWRAVPGAGNENGDPSGAWQVVAGPADDDPDICVEVAASEAPKEVAEFLAAAAQAWGRREQFTTAISHVQQAREEMRSTAGEPMPDMLWVTRLAEQLGKIAAEFCHPAPGDYRERRDRAHEAAVRLAAYAVTWIEAQDASPRDTGR
jgi:hypothetical protein